MIRKFANTLAIGLLLIATACATSPTTPGAPTPPSKTPAQTIALVCPDLTITLQGLQALILPAGAAADLAIASQATNLVCGLGAVVNLTNLQTILTTGLPAVITVIKATNLPVAQQNQVILIVSAAQIVISGILQAQTVITPAAPASAPPPSPSAPASAAAKAMVQFVPAKAASAAK